MESAGAPNSVMVGGVLLGIVAALIAAPIFLMLLIISGVEEEPKEDNSGEIASEISNEVKYSEYINKAATKYDISPALIAAVIKQESSFDPNTTSSAGASGLMQLMPGTAKEVGVKDRFNPRENIMGGTKYLKKMIERYDGNISLGLAAYNAGPGNVKNTIPAIPETMDYVRKVTGYYEDYKSKVQNGKLVAPEWNGKFGRPVSKDIPPGCGMIGCYQGHTGQDFPGPLGSPVMAAANGVVVKVETPSNNSKLGKNRSYGTYVEIKHDDEWSTRYAHMFPKDIKAKVGDKVKQGDVIGGIGNMGNSSGAHLHFEILKKGSPVDPMKYLK